MSSDNKSIVSAAAIKAVQLTRRAQASLMSSHRSSVKTVAVARLSTETDPSGDNRSSKSSLSKRASKSSTEPSTHGSGSDAGSDADSAAAVVMPSTPALVPEDRKRQLSSPQFLTLTAEPQPQTKSRAETAATAEFKEQLAENTKRIADLQDSYQQKLVIDADDKQERQKQKAEAERKERERLDKMAVRHRAAEAVLLKTVPYEESGILSQATIRGMAAWRPGRQMVSDDRFPAFRRS